MKTLVVGAGISGLACADALARSGEDVEVYEASGRAGGRIKTATVADCRVEVGANFLSSTYRVMPRIAQRLGVPLRPIRSRAGLIVDSAALTYAPSAYSMVRAGVIGWGDAARAGWQLVRQLPRLAKANPADPAQWRDIDVPADEWCSARFGQAFTHAVIGSSFRGYYFQDLADTSASAALAMVSYGARPFVTLTADPGLEAIPRALASGLTVHYDAPVVRIERDEAGGALVLSNGESVEADRIVVAVPGPRAASLLADPSPLEGELVSTPYSSGLLVVVALDRRLADSELGGAYGLLASPGEGGEIAALCVSSRAGHAAPGRDAVTVMFDGRVAEARIGRGDSDDELIARAVARLVELVPSVEASVDQADSRVVRIPAAMPTCRVGRVSLVGRYRLEQRGPVVLAGDYLSFPWTDSAALTGLWAANRVRTSGERG
mgnify:CR=1 FL=1